MYEQEEMNVNLDNINEAEIIEENTIINEENTQDDDKQQVDVTADDIF